VDTDRDGGVAGLRVLQQDLVHLLATVLHVRPAVQVPHLCACVEREKFLYRHMLLISGKKQQYILNAMRSEF
jgi:hypothetical protein